MIILKYPNIFEEIILIMFVTDPKTSILFRDSIIPLKKLM
jgi:hypothetical protein